MHGCHDAFLNNHITLTRAVTLMTSITVILRCNMKRFVDFRSKERGMKDLLPPGGVIRKLWITERHLFRDHLLRLDARSRRHRFGGAVSDQFLRDYAELAFSIDTIMHGFFVDGTLRGAAELRP